MLALCRSVPPPVAASGSWRRQVSMMMLSHDAEERVQAGQLCGGAFRHDEKHVGPGQAFLRCLTGRGGIS
jgi:hypothetical protein